MARESHENALLRWDKLQVLQEVYADFKVFLRDVMQELGFNTSEQQEDIADTIQNGPHYLMIQAQRGQAKTTITAAFAVWSLIHNPRARVLIVSAGGDVASDTSTLITRLINTMPELECLRPDPNAGDRTSTEAFDVHHSLKGLDRSPSVSCAGITSNLPGRRADLLIPDDIESPKNSLTATQRAQLVHLTREFTSICSTGRIIYLGTPQSVDSVYNTLPSRGFTVRIWPGRFPTQKQIEYYGDALAPRIKRLMDADPSVMLGGGVAGDQGKPTDPLLLDEETLQTKEQDQTTAHFQLQFMLNTRLADAERYPLKVQDIIFLRTPSARNLPIELFRGYGLQSQLKFEVANVAYQGCRPEVRESQQSAPPQGIIMYIDPAPGGANGDETGYAVTAFLNGNIYVLAVGGIPGGYDVDKMTKLAEIARNWNVSTVIVEKNMGYGAFAEILMPVLRKVHQCGVADDLVTGQKELRIINTLAPVIGRGSLVFNEDIIKSDRDSLEKYAPAKRTVYSLFFQISRLTRDRQSLSHDDRLDALEGAVRYWVKYLTIDQEKLMAQARAAAWRDKIEDPLGHKRYSPPGPSGNNLFKRKRS